MRTSCSYEALSVEQGTSHTWALISVLQILDDTTNSKMRGFKSHR